MGLPWVDSWAPSQFVLQPQVGNIQSDDGATTVNSNQHQQNTDQNLSMKLGAGVILALILVFVLQRLGFRYVIAGSVSTSVGR